MIGRFSCESAETVFTAAILLGVLLLLVGVVREQRVTAARSPSVIIEVGIVESFGDFAICRACEGLGSNRRR